MCLGVPLPCVGTTPTYYLADSLRRTAHIDGRHRLRSSVSDTLVVAPTIATNRSTLGDRAFPAAASRAWNGLPSSVTVRAASSFRQELNTFNYLPVEFSVTLAYTYLTSASRLLFLTLYLARLLHIC